MEKELQAPAGRTVSVGRALWSFAWKWLLAIALVYGALQVLVRMNVFRSQVERELSRLAGMEMRIGRIRATESLNLRIRDAIGVSSLASKRGLRACAGGSSGRAANRCWSRCAWTGWR